MNKLLPRYRGILFFLGTFFLLMSTNAYAQRFTVSGYVKDASSGETLLGANVYVKEIKKGTATNEYGFFSITLEKGTYTLLSSFLGFKSSEIKVELTSNKKVNINLQSAAIQTKEVVVTAEGARKNVESSQMGTENVSIEKIKNLPVIFGEVDILKTLQLLPGVKSGGEGNSGFYVRGGGPDQNLVLLDEAVVYNSGHLFGFFSVFNSDAINSVTLIKGGMPAEYGGRLSSVVAVKMKEGNNQKFHATGGIGLIASRLTVEGPIQKNKSSFILSGRRTYIDILAKPFLDKESPSSRSGYFFYDFNAKANYQFSEKDRVFISGYFGQDKFNFGGERFKVEFPWGNATTTLRWNHVFNDQLFANFTGLFSDYNFAFGGSQADFDFRLYSGVQNKSAKVDFDYFPNIRNHIKFGGLYNFHTFTPSTVSGTASGVSLDPEVINKQYAHELAVYVGDDIDISDRIRVNAGLRYSYFRMVGPYEYYIKDAQGNQDTISYGNGDKIADYGGLEPRLSARFTINTNSSIKASYTRTNQYIHLASVSGSTLPADLWIPSSRLVRPQQATQYAIGYFKNFLQDQYEASVELYYKDLKNQIEFKESDNTPQLNSNVENLFAFGVGRAYGAEFFLKKAQGKFTGWIGYTLSYALRTFPELNSGIEFYAKYDRRHDGSIVLSYAPNDKWNFGAVFVYSSGIAFSLPSKLIVLSDGSLGLAYERDYRNKYRLLPYHRLDVSVTYYFTKTAKRETNLNFSIYNCYNRMNQYFVYLDIQGDIRSGDLSLKAKQVTIFPILPSISYNFKF